MMKLISILLALGLSAFAYAKSTQAPNVILVLTDDQGIGELGCHGNPWIKTPNIDKFYDEAVRFTDFHVSSVCTPTRAAIMTGRYPINNGAWATYKGRDSLAENAYTLAELFQGNGYKTGFFGKWHLVDNYPVRPTDKGFDVAVQHKSGGVGELSDYWGNNYFDDVYLVNNEPKKFEGYCTDIWFDEAIKFIDASKKNKEEPFFIYLPTNAPHGPLYVDEKYAGPYRELVKNKEIVSAEYYGMITNMDENFGKLDDYLKANGLADNTILIFMTDNGTTYGQSRDGKIGYNKGFRGRKGTKEEGGHRVPFFIRWQDGKVSGGRDINEVAAHVDILPTLASLCGLEIREDQEAILDGVDYAPVLLKEKAKVAPRTIFVHNRQDWRQPMDVDQTCIIRDKWRLINGTELYDVETDRGQKKDVSALYPELVEQMLKDNANFLKVTKSNSEYSEFPVSIVGNPIQKEVGLTIQHAIGEDVPIWKSEQVAEGMKNQNNTHALKVERTGTYEISCRRWPKECSGPILGVPSANPKNWFKYGTISPEKVRIKIANQALEKDISKNDEEVLFRVNLEAGKTFLVTDFIEGDSVYGVYYTYVTYVGG